ncbi:MAG: hypothetical protein ACOCXQ_00175 [Patescibacteria group bacterium]
MAIKQTFQAKEDTVIEETLEREQYYESKTRELRLREAREFLNFRKSWSNKLLWLVIMIVIFNAIFLLMVGFKVLTYEDEWLVRIIITGGFIEVLGLAKIVVEFLFKDFPATKKD